MKIVILGTAHPYRGGLAAFNERLAKEFMNGGHEVLISNFTLQYPSILFPGKTQYTDEPAPSGLSIRRMFSSINPFTWFRCGRQLKKMSPDILIVKFWLPFMAPAFGVISRIVKKNGKTKVVCIADNIIPHEHRLGDRVLTHFFARCVDRWVAMSREVYEDIAKVAGNCRRTLAAHPVFDNYGEILPRDQALGNLGLDTDNHYLLFFGFIRGYKGLDLLLESMADPLLEGRKDLKLVIAGEFYGDSSKYYKIIEENALEDRVVLRTDYIPNEQINNYFCAADLIVQPYKTATQSGVTQIGYHFGKPMLVTNVGGLPEIIADRESGYVVEPSSHEIAVAIADFYDNDRYERFAANTVARKALYSWSRLTEAVLRTDF